MLNQRAFKNGILVREIRNGTLITKNLGKTSAQLTAELIASRKQQRPKPTLVQKARNLAGAATRVASAVVHHQPVTVSNEERDRRMDICKACEFFTGSTCRKCGCVILFKAKLNTEHCPIQKW